MKAQEICPQFRNCQLLVMLGLFAALLSCTLARPVALSIDWSGVDGTEESGSILVASGTFIAQNPFLQGPVMLNSGESLVASLRVNIGENKPAFDNDGLFIGFGNSSGGGYVLGEFDTGVPQAEPFRHRARVGSTNLAGTVDLTPLPTESAMPELAATSHFDGDNTVTVRFAVTRTADGFDLETRWNDTVFNTTVSTDEWAPGEDTLDTFFFRSRQSADWEVTNVLVEYETLQGLDPDLLIETVSLPGRTGINSEALMFVAPISNGGASMDLEIDSVVVEGEAEAQFTVDSFPSTLAPGASGEIALTFNAAGLSGTFETTLIVNANTEDSPLSVPLATRVPLITTFRPSPTVINNGASATLSWVVDPRAELSMDPDVGDLAGAMVNGSGSLTIAPLADTDYTLTASLEDDQQSRSVPVTVLQTIERGPVPVEESWTFSAGSGDGTENSLSGSGTFIARQPFAVGQLALAEGDFLSARMRIANGDLKPDVNEDGLFIGFGNSEAGGYILSELDTGSIGEEFVRHRHRVGGTNLASTVDLIPATNLTGIELVPDENQQFTGDHTVDLEVILGRTGEGYLFETIWGTARYSSVIPFENWSPENHAIDTFFFRARQEADWEVTSLAVQFNLAGQDPDLAVATNPIQGLEPDAGPYQLSIPLTNNGKEETLEIESILVVGPDQDLFTIGDRPTAIPPQGSEPVTLTFAPSGRRGGFAALLEVQSNDSADKVSQWDLSTFTGNSGNLIAHYRFDEIESTDPVYDYSGRGSHGVYQIGDGAMIAVSQDPLASGTSVTLTPGEEEAAYVEIPANSGIPPLEEFSLSLWFQGNPNAESVSVLFSKGDALGDPFSFALAGDSLLWVSNGQQSEPFAGVVTGGPQHLVAVASAEELTLYLDGETQGTMTVDPFDDSRSSALRFGSLNSLFGFRGSLDDAQLYNRVLSSKDAAFLSQNPGAVLPAEDSGIAPGDVGSANLRRTADNGVEINWVSKDDLGYTVQYSETLLPDSWQEVDANAQPPYTDTAVERVGNATGFYRILVER